MKNRNVIQFMKYSAPYKGNFIQTLLCLEERLNAENIQMVYLFFNETSKTDWVKELIKEGKVIYFLSGNKIKDFFTIARIIKKHNAGIIHNHFIGVANIFFINLINLFRKERCFVVRHLHNPYVQNKQIVEYLKKTVAHVDLSIGCSGAVAADYDSKKMDKREKVVYATNAIDFSRLDSYEVLDRKAMGIEKDYFILLVFGFDYFRKGIDILINAVSELVQENVPVCLVISLANNKSFAGNLIKEQFGNIPRWIRLAEPRNDISTYYKFSDAFISSSRSEGFCYSLVEAAYCGTQIIASEIFAQKDLNIPFTFRYGVEDIPELKKQIVLAAAVDPNERAERSKVQKKYVVSTFDLHKWAETVFQFYQYYFADQHLKKNEGRENQSYFVKQK